MSESDFLKKISFHKKLLHLRCTRHQAREKKIEFPIPQMEEDNQEAFQCQHHHHPIKRDTEQCGVNDVNLHRCVRHFNHEKAEIDRSVQKVDDGE